MANKTFNQDSNLYVNNGKFVGGYGNVSTGNTATFIGGGQGNIIDNTSNYTSIIGGYYNNISLGRYSNIGGGSYNNIGGNPAGYGTFSEYTNIGGGRNNTIIFP